MSERDLEYEKNNTIYDELRSELGIKCKNYEICENILPLWWWDCKNHYWCTECDIRFGTWGTGENAHFGRGELIISENIECPLCFEIKRGILQPRCEHVLCVDCFKRYYNGAPIMCPSPPLFPYPELEDEYDNDPTHPKWGNQYPLINQYIVDKFYWDIVAEYINKINCDKCVKEGYIEKCPICKK